MSALKDLVINPVLKPLINLYISDLGSFDKLKVDSSKKQISLQINLDGEKTPISVEVQEYTLDKKEEQNFLVIKKIDFSREWINKALKKWHPELRFPIPVIAKKLL